MSTTVLVLVATLIVVSIVAIVLMMTNRLRRLHIRTDAAFAALVAALAHRIAVARKIASIADVGDLVMLADAAVNASAKDRAHYENALTGVLRTVAHLPSMMHQDLFDISQRIDCAAAIYKQLARTTVALRRGRMVRLLRLAGEFGRPVDFPLDPVRAAEQRGHLHARVVLLDERERILLCAQRDSITADARVWCIPGGWVAAGESAARCAVRHLWIETGIYPDETDFIGPIRIHGGRNGVEPVTLTRNVEEWFYLLRVHSGCDDKTRLAYGLDALARSEHRWCTITELDDDELSILPGTLSEMLYIFANAENGLPELLGRLK